MIVIYDLYDLHYIFIGIRCFPNYELNGEVLLKVIDVLENRHSNNDFNQFRAALQSINSLDKEDYYKFAFVENKYTYFPLFFLKDENVYVILIEACKRLLEAVDEKNEQKIYALADLLEYLPISITENNYSIPKIFWKKFVTHYRNKWDKSFLINEQKMG
ncbi:MAG: hypothetical protein LBQ48_04420 [Oscillospiraceae bacterium]|jgi:hypothetical protein|nr:hypothetical protein [Oscillospiraceae bacterium]